MNLEPPVTLKEYVDTRLRDMNDRINASLQDNKEAIEDLDKEVSRRFDGMDTNLDRVIATVNERGGGVNLLRTLVPNVISLGSLIALIVVAKH